MVRETFISVDVEASGPIPGEYSMLSLGACVVGAPADTFYLELKPITRNHDPEALIVTGFDLDDLERRGVEPGYAMAQFEAWTSHVASGGGRPVFVAYPIAFDWMFVAYYFHRFLGRNPFGIDGLDVKSFYLGITGGPYTLAGSSDLDSAFAPDPALTHNALEDAVAQATLFERLQTLQRSRDGR